MEMKAKPGSSSPKKSHRVEFRETFERNFITQGGALKEFFLKPTELEGLNKHFRRSPYKTEATIMVYKRKDVEKRALEVWGSLEAIEREKRNREHIKKMEEIYNYEIKKSLREARRTDDSEGGKIKKKTNEPYIVIIALLVDVLNLIFKLLVYLYSNSDSLLAETIHSAADTLNQTILAVGLCQLSQGANSRHPYGYSNTMYVVSLISGVGIFCLGCAVTVFNGFLSIISNHHELIYDDILWAFVVLGFSTATESIGFFCSVFATYKDSKKHKAKFLYYAFSGVEPGLTVILLEDFGAVLGNLIAGFMLFTSWRTESRMPDAVGSILIGILLGVVAIFLIVTNSAALVGRSIPNDRLEGINKVLESDVMIRAIYDVKGIDIGNNLVRYKAEIDFDGAELTRLYLDHLDLNELLQEVKNISDIDDLENFMVAQGENIVDLLGGEIDRIEIKVRSVFPEVRHVDLEIV